MANIRIVRDHWGDYLDEAGAARWRQKLARQNRNFLRALRREKTPPKVAYNAYMKVYMRAYRAKKKAEALG